jgi:hypothetical protein
VQLTGLGKSSTYNLRLFQLGQPSQASIMYWMYRTQSEDLDVVADMYEHLQEMHDLEPYVSCMILTASYLVIQTAMAVAEFTNMAKVILQGGECNDRYQLSCLYGIYADTSDFDDLSFTGISAWNAQVVIVASYNTSERKRIRRMRDRITRVRRQRQGQSRRSLETRHCSRVCRAAGVGIKQTSRPHEAWFASLYLRFLYNI